jgi:hypothetical protein
LKFLLLAQSVLCVALLAMYVRVRWHRSLCCVMLAKIIDETQGRKGVVSYSTMQAALKVLGVALGKN